MFALSVRGCAVGEEGLSETLGKALLLGLSHNVVGIAGGF